MDETWRRPEQDSPCINICVIHRESGFCMGCYRTGDEIAAWSRMAPDARQQLLQALPARAAHVKGQRRGGRKNRR